MSPPHCSFFAVLANLSFMAPGDERAGEPGADDKLRKIRELDKYLQGRTALAWVLDQFLAIDESMIRCNSRWCGFLQYMPRKPIKRGIKVFCLADATKNYLFSWDVYTSPSGWSVHDLVTKDLLTDTFDCRGYVVVMDSYFTSIKTFEELDARGIGAIGPSSAVRPEAENKRTGNSWPLQTYTKGVLDRLERGWRRVASRTMPKTGRTMRATVWRDRKFVTLLSTCFNTDDIVYLRRWLGETARREWVPGSLPLAIYQKYMAAIDQLDRFIATARIGMHHCSRRFQRSIFFWQVSGITSNTFEVAKALIAPALMAKLERYDTGGSSIGLGTYLQSELAIALILRGTRAGEDALAPEQQKQGEMPPWVPGRKGRPPLHGGIAGLTPQSVVHRWDERLFDDEGGRCHGCQQVATVTDEAKARNCGAQGKSTPGGHAIAQRVRSGCSGCEMRICGRCIEVWSHIERRRAASRPEIDPKWPCRITCGKQVFLPPVQEQIGSGAPPASGTASRPAAARSLEAALPQARAEDEPPASTQRVDARKRTRNSASAEELLPGGEFRKASSR